MTRQTLSGERSVRVLQSIGPQLPSKITNPFTVLLIQSMPATVTTLHFTWLTAFARRYDVFHVHWPEHLIRGSGLPAKIKPILFRILLWRLRVFNVKVVRTLHNIRPHEGGRPTEARLLELLDKQTDAWIILNGTSPVEHPERTRIIPHGHYREWYHPSTDVAPRRGTLLYFGGIRPYKGVFPLLAALEGTDETVALSILGRPVDAATREAVELAVAQDDRVRADLRFVSDEELTVAITESERVILPYSDLHNSGSLILALSLNRQVIVPSTPSTRELLSEFGSLWVVLYDGDLTTEILARVLRSPLPTPEMRLDMSSRDWGPIGERHADLYHRVREGHAVGVAQTDAATATEGQDEHMTSGLSERIQ